MSATPTAEALAEQAGTDLRAVARKWPVYKPNLSDRQIKNRIRQIRSALRHGRLPSYSAARLAELLGCDPGVFLYGTDHFRGVNTRSGATGSCPAAARSGQLRRRDRPTTSGLRAV